VRDDVTVIEKDGCSGLNDHPVLTVTPVSGYVSGTITVGYSIRDTEGDPVDIEVSFSTDDGATWLDAQLQAVYGGPDRRQV
jgi:hypothetical protein